MSQGNNLVLQELQLSKGASWQFNGHGVFFAFIKKGRGIYQGPKHQQVLSAGDVIVCDSSSAECWSLLATGALTIRYFHVWLDSLLPLFSSSELCGLEKLRSRLASPLCHSEADPIAKKCHDLVGAASSQNSLEHRCQLLRVVAILFSEYLIAGENSAASQDPRLSRMMESLNQLTADDIQNLSVSQLSKKCGCCRRHLNRLFQERFGTSVAALKMELRMLKAAALLRDPSAKIINVAMETGFNHLGLFSNYFKRRFGTTPSEWRRRESSSTAANLSETASKLVAITPSPLVLPPFLGSLTHPSPPLQAASSNR